MYALNNLNTDQNLLKKKKNLYTDNKSKIKQKL